MKKQIALGIAAAVIGVSGVASAFVSVDQLTSAANSTASLSAVTDSLAANCWMVTGSASDAGCNTSIAGIEVPGLPELPNQVAGVDIPDATGLLAMASNAVDTATGAVGSAQSIVGSLVPTATGLAGGAMPSDCNLPVALPVKLPIPTGIFSAGLNLFHMAQGLAMNDLGAAGLALPVALPVDLPVGVPTADDLINTIEDQTSCLAQQSSGLPIPAVCSLTAGAPAAVTSVVPGAISGLLSTVISDLTNITGQAVNVAEGGNVGLNCNVDDALGGATDAASGLVPSLPGLPSLPGIPALNLPVVPVPAVNPAAPLPIPAAPAIPDVVGTVGGVLDTVTGLVDGVLGSDLPLSVPALPLPTSTPDCSASASGSANLLGGLLGSLTSTITGGCN